MAATPHETWCLDEEDTAAVPLDAAQAQDAFWAQAHARENYFRTGLVYEDYAPAYCVGYVGRAQYGGEFEDAEKSLLANWLRIKGDSRLGLDEARMAIRAAWDRAAQPVADSAPAAVPARGRTWPLLTGLRGLLQGVNAWLDRLDQRLWGHRAARPVASRAQQSGLVRH